MIISYFKFTDGEALVSSSRVESSSSFNDVLIVVFTVCDGAFDGMSDEAFNGICISGNVEEIGVVGIGVVCVGVIDPACVVLVGSVCVVVIGSVCVVIIGSICVVVIGVVGIVLFDLLCILLIDAVCVVLIGSVCVR